MDRKRACLLFLVVQCTAETLVTKRSSESPYHTRSLVLVCELMKLLSYAAILAVQGLLWPSAARGGPIRAPTAPGRWRDHLRIAVPAVLYVVQNNLLFLSVRLLDLGTQTVTYQVKILTTAFFSVWLLGKRLTRRQWWSLVLLMLGVVLVQFSPAPRSPPRPQASGSLSDYGLGLLCVLAASLTSGFAGVYTERLFKTQSISYWHRSLLLCLLSIAISGLSVAVDPSIRRMGVLWNFGAWTWLSAALKACGGLAVAMVMRYADNILKGFAVSCTIVLSSLLSALFLGFRITVPFVAGTAIVLYSVYLYGSEELHRSVD